MVSPTIFTPFRNFAQIAYVTTDYEQALGQFANHYGVSEWMHLPESEIEVGDGAVGRLKVGLAYVGDLQLELIEPCGGDDSVYRSSLPDNGFAVRFHHVAQLMESGAELDAALAAAEAQGVPIAIHGTIAGGMGRYFYTDHRSSLGHFIEHIWYAPEVRPIFEQIPRN